ncbi:MAG: dihydropteroate synthase [Acidimicrobiia bacterium]|jgi:dihydropteroate synthase|nr:dihydropteroate synthase [Acidimicrobiia bacterium]MBP8180010.1 dihydropteroate synthase [Acidimicrobiia bacterium]
MHDSEMLCQPSEVFPEVRLGNRIYDTRSRSLIMGILNRTPDSFYDKGLTWDFDAFLSRAQTLVDEGADILDVGGVKAGPGDEVTEQMELDRVIPAIVALHERFDIPISVDTWRASVFEEGCRQGAVLGNDISGLADPDYVPVAVRHGASVVATHIRLRPRVPDPEPHYDDLVGDVTKFLLDRANGALAGGLEPSQVILDCGLDLGKTPAMSAILLRESAHFARLGFPLLLSASNKGVLGEIGTKRPVTDRRVESLAATGWGAMLGCRVQRVHDVAGSRRVCDMVEVLLDARSGCERARQDVR